MSFPTIPNINPSINISRTDVINLLLSSVAFEELGLSHIINSEAEKLQFVLGTIPGLTPPSPPTTDDLLEVNSSVRQMLRTVLKNQMLLEFKLEDLIGLPAPAISIQKFISVDNGVTWLDANTPPGPTLVGPANPLYKFVVTNTGNVTLTGVSVSDSVLGPLSIGGILPAGATFEQIHAGIFAFGQQMNTARVVATYQDQQLEATDVAYYVGI